jgi:gliding motility-associated-like protein
MKMILLSRAAKQLLSCLLVLFLRHHLHAQTTVFAELKGNPLNTNGWRLAGQAYVGDTGGDADTDRDELILTDPLNFTSGSVFFQSALNLATCQRWTAEFDFRMWEGTAADGIAFCFLANPPTGAVVGGGIGIPPRPRGLMVVLDTWQNCLGATPVPNVQIRFEQGQRDYSECPQPPQPTSATLPLRSNQYQRCRISYQNGLVIVSINGTPVVRGQFNINFPGYFGFTAATGGATDRHSIKNFTMLTDPVVAASAFAGNDLTACHGQTIQIGTNPVPGEQYRYSWFPTTGLSNPNIPNPTLTITNNSPQPLRLSYFVTKDTLASGNICGRVDEIIINVPGRVANAGPDVLTCSGVPFQNAPQALPGYRYQWTALDGAPLSFLNNTQVASPTFTPVNNGTEPIKLRYVQTATLIAPPGCSNSDTVEITVAPAITRGIKTFRLCSGQTQQIGIAPVQGFAYTWSPAAGLSSSTIANPTFTGLVVNDADSVVRRYVLTVQAANSCLVRDTVEIRVLRNVTANAGPDLQICGDTTIRLGVAPQSGLRYQWSPATGLSDATVANPSLQITATAAEQRLRYVLTVSNGLEACTRRDTVLIRVAPRIAQPVGRKTVRVCAGDAVSLGFERIAGLRYRWSPAAGLSSDTVSNPTLRTAAITADSVQTRYILTISNNNCLVRDTTDLIVYRRPQAQAGADVQVCAGQPVRLGSAPVAGLTYLWTPATDLSSATVANPLATIQHNGNTPLVRTYILRVRNAQGCESRDTVQITVSRQPAAPNISRTVRVCSGDTVRIGAAPMEGSRYSWTPAAHLSAANVANPIFRLTLSDTVARTLTYIRRDSAGICSRTDTFLITVTPRLPKLQVQGAIVACPGVQNIVYRIANPRAGLAYRWQVTGGTLVSGQGTTAIQVNWNVANPQASVSVQYADAALCTFGGDTLRVAVGLNLQPPRPIGEADTLCVTEAGNVRYQLPVSSAGAVYQWFTQGGGTITSGQGTNAVVINWRNVVFPAGSTAALPVRIWVTETLTTPVARCFGTSDTLTIWLKPAPSATAITGSTSICEGSTATYQLNGAANSRYRWEVQGGTLVSGQGTTAVTVRWNSLNGSLQPLQGRVQAIETTALGCIGEAITLPVTVHPLPRPRIVQNDSLICANRLGGYRYEVAGWNGSQFVWQISGGTITEASADSSRIVILWNNSTFPKQVRVRERSAAGCLSPTLLSLPVYFDATTIQMLAVSVVPTDDSQVQVRFRISGAPDLPQVFQVERRTGSADFTPIGTVRTTDTLFTDRNLNTDANRYEYRIVRQSQTGNCSTNVGNPHTTMQLSGEAQENTISLNWTAYQGWQQVARYEIWRKLDDATAFTRIGTANTLNFNDINALDGFRHCLRIRAIEAGTGRESWSNEICLDFEHAINIPNVITPNNDGRNDRFIIPQLPLYRSHTLELFNRWGGLLFSTDNYKQDWDGEGLPAGTYYYRLQANRPLPDGSLQPFEFKGWLQVIRE